MPHFTEETLEKAIIELLTRQRYSYTAGAEIHKEVSEVVLWDDLRLYLRAKYKAEGITDGEVERAMARITASQSQSLYDNNVKTLKLLRDGFSLRRDDNSLSDLFIRPIDFNPDKPQNILRIVNQLEIKGGHTRIPDTILYINGLPLVVFEFKSAVKINTTLIDAYTQLTVRYKRDIPELFKYNAFVVISDGVNSKYGSLFTPYEFFYSWRKVNPTDTAEDGINSLYTMVEGMFAPERLLSIIKDFVFTPDSSKKETKIVCRYPQFFATHKLFESIRTHSKQREEGDGKGGTYFGTTGCGKSYTMLFLTRMLMRSREFNSPTIIIITDRTDLDTQLSEQFLTAKEFVGDSCIVSVESRAKLREHLLDRPSGGVFLTTIHKFNEDTKLLSERTNIICISDEAHRSQANLELQVRQTDKGVKRSYGFAKHLRDSLPNATYVGFTGTPVDSTIDVFGEVVDAYTMTESVADGITRRIVYEGRAAKVMVDNAVLAEIEEYYKRCAEEGANEHQIEESKKASASLASILGDEDRLKAVAADFVEHYEQRVSEGSSVMGKAMIVCANRTIAYHLYRQIVALRPEWQEAQQGVDLSKKEQEEILPLERIKLIMTRSKDDPKELWDLLGSDKSREGLDKQFKSEKSNFKIAIVVDMWITGFDVPCLDTMYIDKPIQQHTLIQTISRVNRVYPNKDKGLVVDYIGIKNNLNSALKRYTGGDINQVPIETVEQSVVMVKDQLDLLRRLFNKFDYTKFSTGSPLEQLECLNHSAEFIQRTKESENLFMGHTKKLKSAYSLCSSSDQISAEEREDIYFFSGVASIIHKLTKGNAPDAAQMNRRVQELVEAAIQSDGIEEIIQIDNNNDIDLDIMSEEYMARLEKIKLPNTKVKLMEQLLRRVITEFKKVNKMQGIDFTKKLNDLVVQYNDRSDNAIFANEVLDEVAEQMAQLLKDINKEKSSFLEMGISFEEKAFYDILKAIAKQFGFNYPEDKLLKLAEAVRKIVDDKSKYTDWANRNDIKAELKMDLILVLSEHGYPPVDHYDDVYKEILEQAENFKKYSE
ncbi:MAG: type I restriction endonuclease subunit R [Rikenellaceae bacterium]